MHKSDINTRNKHLFDCFLSVVNIYRGFTLKTSSILWLCGFCDILWENEVRKPVNCKVRIFSRFLLPLYCNNKFITTCLTMCYILFRKASIVMLKSRATSSVSSTQQDHGIRIVLGFHLWNEPGSAVLWMTTRGMLKKKKKHVNLHWTHVKMSNFTASVNIFTSV